MSALSRERIAPDVIEHLRDHANGADRARMGVWVYYDAKTGEEEAACIPADRLLALLDAYEAQRPRPASEVPERHRDVLGYVGGEWREAAHSGEAWYVYADGDAQETDDLTWWLPLPEVPR